MEHKHPISDDDMSKLSRYFHDLPCIQQLLERSVPLKMNATGCAVLYDCEMIAGLHEAFYCRVAPDRVKSHTQVCGDRLRLCGGRGAMYIYRTPRECLHGLSQSAALLSVQYSPVHRQPMWMNCSAILHPGE